ncbi:mitochondrial carnitine/acylcarnitine carrier protein [Peziza echinospora]|nr:mitochondrial carnitine/acylcarnitine carrier protein [Peziza echinospora]
MSTDHEQISAPVASSSPNLQPTHPYKGFVAGIFSGVTKLTVGHPFDTLKVRLQTSPPSQFTGAIDCLRKTLKREGVRGLYKGATPPLVGWMFMDSIMLGSMTTYRTLLMKHYFTTPLYTRFSTTSAAPLARTDKIPHHGAALAGLVAGWTVSFVATPIEHLKARLQVQYHDPRNPTARHFTPLTLPAHLLKTHGPLALLLHGLKPTLLFRSSFAVLWYTYSRTTEYLQKNHPAMPEMLVNFVAGGASAQVFWCVGYPFDVVKQRIMVDPLVGSASRAASGGGPRVWWRGGEIGYGGGQRYGRSWWKAVVGVYEDAGGRERWTKGVRGFFRGFGPSFLRAFPANAMALVMFEAVMRGLP